MNWFKESVDKILIPEDNMNWFKESVDKIVADFDSVKTRLLALAEAKTAEADKHVNAAASSNAMADAATTEAIRANSIASKIDSLLK